MLLKAGIEDFCMRLERDHPGAPAAATLQHFYTLFNEREALGRKMADMHATLKQLADYPLVSTADYNAADMREIARECISQLSGPAQTRDQGEA